MGLQERYQTFQDPEQGADNIPPFHYGSHYSSAALVLFFLLRIQPFTALNKELQGGCFDIPDRLFHSIPGLWQCTFRNVSDVKELIPEFYLSPAFLVNEQKLQLGTTQDKQVVDDVVLPVWASSPADFIAKHRGALESPHVSRHLHHWIDLIFGWAGKGL